MTGHVLFIERTLEAPLENVWRCWTEPDLLRKWFTPAPWKTVEAEIDLRAGGTMSVVMESPEGERIPNPGQFLEIVPRRRLVMTDAYLGDWQPSEKPFMTSIITFADAGPGRTSYRAEARHWTGEDRKSHEEMGFEPGWNAAADQLETLAKAL